MQRVERYFFIRLTPEHSTDAGRREVAQRFAQLAAGPAGAGPTAVDVGTPADAGARAAWDLSLSLRFDSLSAAETYLQRQHFRDFLETYLTPRAVVIKAWTFEYD